MDVTDVGLKLQVAFDGNPVFAKISYDQNLSHNNVTSLSISS